MARNRILAAVVVAAVSLGSAVPAAAEEGTERLRDAWNRLGDARDGLDDAERSVDEAAAALELIEADLDAHTARLVRLDEELAGAERAYAAARARTEVVNVRLRAVDRRLQSIVDEGDRHRDRLDAMAADTYMHGGPARAGAVFSTLLGASDLHDLTVGARVVASQLDEDQELVDRSRDTTITSARARREVAALRAERQREEAAAERARDRVAAIARRQRAVNADIAAERDRRAEILAAVEADREQAAALVARLQEASAALAGELAGAIDARWEDLEIDGPMPVWADRIPAHGRRWAPAIEQAAAQVGIDPRLLAALVWSESNFHPGAISHAGAVGLAQLMPGTAASLGVDPYHPLQNLAGGARYLAVQHARFGSVELALAAYNAGPGAVERYGGIPPYAETQYYVLAVLTRYGRIAAP